MESEGRALMVLLRTPRSKSRTCSRLHGVRRECNAARCCERQSRDVRCEHGEQRQHHDRPRPPQGKSRPCVERRFLRVSLSANIAHREQRAHTHAPIPTHPRKFPHTDSGLF